MESKELMIGNVIAYCTHPVVVESIGKNSFGFTYLDKRVSTEFQREPNAINFKPIPITPVILEKAGFVKDKIGNYCLSINPHKAGLKQLCFSGDYLLLRQGDHENPRMQDDLVALWNKDLMKEFYLHQLQNLYYALTTTTLLINI